MTLLKHRAAWLALALLLSFAPRAHADSLVFENQIGNTYHYDITTDYLPTGFTFQNQPIYNDDLTSLALTGLSGVTGVTVTANLATDLGLTCVYTATTVSCSRTSNNASFTSGLVTLGDLAITSTAPAGTVAFRIVDVGPDTPGPSGTVIGPVASGTTPTAPTPEPSTLLLLGTGVAAIAGSARRLSCGVTSRP